MDKIALGYYQHFKGGIYRVILTAKHEKTKEDLVVYQSAQGDLEVWVRTQANFLEEVEDDEGRKVPRFQKIR